MLFTGIGVVLDGTLILFFEGRVPHFPARGTFGRSGLLTFLFHASGGPISFSSEKGRVPRFRARVTFGRSPKSDQKRCLKPQVSRLPARLGCAENRRRVPRAT